MQLDAPPTVQKEGCRCEHQSVDKGGVLSDAPQSVQTRHVVGHTGNKEGMQLEALQRGQRRDAIGSSPECTQERAHKKHVRQCKGVIQLGHAHQSVKDRGLLRPCSELSENTEPLMKKYKN